MNSSLWTETRVSRTEQVPMLRGMYDSHSDSKTNHPPRSALQNGRGLRHAKFCERRRRVIGDRRRRSRVSTLDDSGSELQAEGQTRHFSVHEWRAFAGG